MRKFNIGDSVIHKDGLKYVAGGEQSIKSAAKPVVQITELVDDGTIIHKYLLAGMSGWVKEENIFPVKDAKKMVMTILAARMQDVAGMEVPS